MRATAWIIWLAISVHALWGVLLLIYGSSVTGVTAIHHTTMLIADPTLLGWAYVAVAVSATAGMIGAFDRLTRSCLGGEWTHGVRLLELMPQQALLIFSAVGAAIAIGNSAFADGVARSREFIAADQCQAILLAVFHTCAVLEPYVRRLRLSDADHDKD